MKKLLVLTALPLITVTGLLTIGFIAIIKAIEEAHDDEFFWE